MNFQLKGYDRVQALYLIKKDIKKNGDRFGEKKRSLEKLKQIQKIKPPSYFKITQYNIERIPSTKNKRNKNPFYSIENEKYSYNKIPYYTLSSFKETFGNLDIFNNGIISNNNENKKSENKNKKNNKKNKHNTNNFDDIPPILPVKKNRWLRNENNKSIDYELSNNTNLVSIATNTDKDEDDDILFQTEPNKNINNYFKDREIVINKLRENGMLIDKRLSNKNYFNHHHKFLDLIDSKKDFFDASRRSQMYKKYKIFPSTLNEGHLNYKDFFVEENGIIFPKTDIEERRDFRKRRKRLRQLRNNL